MDIDIPPLFMNIEDRNNNATGNLAPLTYTDNDYNSVHKGKLLLTKLNYTYMYQENDRKSCNDVYKVCTAMNCLMGPTLTWFGHKYGEQLPTWDQFWEEFIKEYCSTDEFEPDKLRQNIMLVFKEVTT